VQDGLGDCLRKEGAADSMRSHKDKGVFTSYQDRAISLHCDAKSLAASAKGFSKPKK
jgi:hypothetical protein